MSLNGRSISARSSTAHVFASMGSVALCSRFTLLFRLRGVIRAFNTTSKTREKLGCLYTRHTGGAVPLRILVKTAITVVVTPPIVFHSFRHPSHHNRRSGSPKGRQSTFSRLHCGGTGMMVVLLWSLYGATAVMGCHGDQWRIQVFFWLPGNPPPPRP